MMGDFLNISLRKPTDLQESQGPGWQGLAQGCEQPSGRDF